MAQGILTYFASEAAVICSLIKGEPVEQEVSEASASYLNSILGNPL
jgi:hypothetical protein